ncbi:hypothetical protein Hanom_Chr12g01149011 [Helianthus anomalus]
MQQDTCNISACTQDSRDPRNCHVYEKLQDCQSGPRPIKRPFGPSPSLFSYKYPLRVRFEVTLICSLTITT